MPWRKTSVMEERLRFVARLLEGEGMREVCRDFGISRKTGYKIFNRYRQDGLEALTDRSRRPVRYANQLPAQIEAMIIASKAALDRHGLVVQARKRHRHKTEGTGLSHAIVPNDFWCVDFKGEFKLGDGRSCYPLTVPDQASRYLLAFESFSSNKELPVIDAFRRLFAERGLPDAIRSDNGVSFASLNVAL